jgi:hypothetical protein
MNKLKSLLTWCKEMVMAQSKYPAWVCHMCGMQHGNWYQAEEYIGPLNHCSTWHTGTCDVCKDVKVPVTEPRDYGHLRDTWNSKK